MNFKISLETYLDLDSKLALLIISKSNYFKIIDQYELIVLNLLFQNFIGHFNTNLKVF